MIYTLTTTSSYQRLMAMLPSERASMRALGTACGALFLMYVYFVGTVVFGTVERKVTETKIRDIRAEVAQKEVEYLNLTGDLDLEKAYAYGLVEAKQVSFASVSANVAMAASGRDH